MNITGSQTEQGFYNDPGIHIPEANGKLNLVERLTQLAAKRIKSTVDVRGEPEIVAKGLGFYAVPDIPMALDVVRNTADQVGVPLNKCLLTFDLDGLLVHNLFGNDQKAMDQIQQSVFTGNVLFKTNRSWFLLNEQTLKPWLDQNGVLQDTFWGMDQQTPFIKTKKDWEPWINRVEGIRPELIADFSDMFTIVMPSFQDFAPWFISQGHLMHKTLERFRDDSLLMHRDLRGFRDDGLTIPYHMNVGINPWLNRVVVAH